MASAKTSLFVVSHLHPNLRKQRGKKKEVHPRNIEQKMVGVIELVVDYLVLPLQKQHDYQEKVYRDRKGVYPCRDYRCAKKLISSHVPSYYLKSTALPFYGILLTLHFLFTRVRSFAYRHPRLSY